MAHRGRGNADEVLAAELAAGSTVRAAAEAAGVAERTAYRRWSDPKFRARVSGLRGEMLGRAAGQFADGLAEATRTMRELLNDMYPPAVRLGAARSIAEFATKIREAVDLEARVAALEQRDTPPPTPQEPES